jgi:hypothetical protein
MRRVIGCLPPELDWHLAYHSGKSDKLMNEEKRYVPKFFFNKRMSVKTIIDRLKGHYEKDAICFSIVYY